MVHGSGAVERFLVARTKDPSYSVRIPAAIKKAALKLEENAPSDCISEGPVRFTEIEVALAKALWKHADGFGIWERMDEEGVFDWYHEAKDALIAFCDKVERL